MSHGRVLRLPFLSTDAKQIEEVFKCCAALHNMLLKFDGRDTIGELDDDWLRADIEADDARIGRGALIRCDREERVMTSDTDFSCVGGAPESLSSEPTETDDDFVTRRKALVANFEHMWLSDEGIQWLETAAVARSRRT